MALPPTLGPDRRPTPSTFFLTVHRALRRDAHRFPAAIRAGVDPTAITGHWSRYRAILVGHHAHEDELLFPAMRAAHPELAGVLDGLAADHDALDGVLVEVDAAFGAIAAAPGRAAEAAERLADVVDRHLDREEEHLVPPMERDGAAGPPPDAGPRDGFDDPAFQLPWLTDDLDPGLVDVLLGALPSPLQEAFPGWRAAYGAGPLAVGSGAVA
jgi:hypothetical protein